MSDEEFISRAVGAQCEAAIRAFDDNCRVVDYDDFGVDMMMVIARWFSLDIETQLPDVREVLKTYSKDPRKQLVFTDDRQRKRGGASDLIVEMVAKWAMESYLRLRQYQRLEVGALLGCASGTDAGLRGSGPSGAMGGVKDTDGTTNGRDKSC
jgi:hypothetical protein